MEQKSKKNLEEAYQWLKLGIHKGMSAMIDEINSRNNRRMYLSNHIYYFLTDFRTRLQGEEFPQSFPQLDEGCQYAIVEIFCCNSSTAWFPLELVTHMIQNLILVWPDEHHDYEIEGIPIKRFRAVPSFSQKLL